MAELFEVSGSGFIEALEQRSLAQKNTLNLLDVFEAYVALAAQSSNACEPNMLRSLIFKQFQQYGDHDKEVQQTAKAVSDIVDTTDEVITAIENKDDTQLSNAYEKLKNHQEKIISINNAIIKDEFGIYNRKYFYISLLGADHIYTEHGFLFSLYVQDLESIEADFGPLVVRSILKKFSQTTQKGLAESPCDLIHYEDNAFLILALQKDAKDIRTILKLLHRTFEVKKFKVPDSKQLTFNFHYDELVVQKGETFTSPFEN